MRLLLWFTLLWSGLLQAAPDYLSFKTEDEANSTEIYQKASPAVVHVTNTALRREFLSRNIQEVPQGSGTGFSESVLR